MAGITSVSIISTPIDWVGITNILTPFLLLGITFFLNHQSGVRQKRFEFLQRFESLSSDLYMSINEYGIYIEHIRFGTQQELQCKDSDFKLFHMQNKLALEVERAKALIKTHKDLTLLQQMLNDDVTKDLGDTINKYFKDQNEGTRGKINSELNKLDKAVRADLTKWLKP